jgi:hypothetical protein
MAYDAEAHEQIVNENGEMLKQLGLAGKGLLPSFFVECAVEALVEYLLDDDEVKEFQAISDRNINDKLHQITSKMSGLVVAEAKAPADVKLLRPRTD